MSKQWKLTLAVLGLGLAVLAAQAQSVPLDGVSAESAPAYEGTLRSLQVDSDPLGRPMVMLDTGGVLDYESFVLDAPDRLVVDLRGAVSLLDEYRFPVEAGGVARVRAGQHVLEPEPVTRVVFDLERPLAYSIEEHGNSLFVIFGDEADASLLGRETQAVPEPELVVAMREAADAQGAPANDDPVETEVVEQVEPQPAVAEAPAPVVETERFEPQLATKTEPAPAEDTFETALEGHETATTLEQEAETEATDWALNLPEPATEPVEQAPAQPVATTAVPEPSRAVEPDEIEALLSGPSLAAPAEDSERPAVPASFRSKTIVTSETVYSGKRISLNLVDADIKQVFRLFHEISGLNFVLDPGVDGRVTIVLDQVPWDQALDLILKNNGLDKVLEGNVLRIASSQRLAQEAASRKQLKEAEELEVEPITLTRVLSYAKAVDVERVISGGGILTSRGKVIVDERTNTLIISDIPKKVDPLDALINTLDAETPQVMIEARIVETSRNYSRELGIQWGFGASADAAHGTSTGLAFPHNASARYGLNLPGQQASTLAFSFGNVIDSFTLDVALNALETEGYGRILSAPKIATQNNERAEIEQGVRIPIVNTTATEINVEFVSASLRLVVTPQITAEGTIVLDIIVENNSPDFVNTAGDIPSIRTQRAQTKVLITDGGTTVIGGIFVVNEGQSEIGVPWFRKIPGLGWAFRNRQIQNENRELLIFITPKIVQLG